MSDRNRLLGSAALVLLMGTGALWAGVVEAPVDEPSIVVGDEGAPTDQDTAVDGSQDDGSGDIGVIFEGDGEGDVDGEIQIDGDEGTIWEDGGYEEGDVTITITDEGGEIIALPVEEVDGEPVLVYDLGSEPGVEMQSGAGGAPAPEQRGHAVANNPDGGSDCQTMFLPRRGVVCQ